VTAFLDVEGRGGLGAAHDGRLIAVPYTLASSIIFATNTAPAAAGVHLDTLSAIVTSNRGLVECGGRLPHLILTFLDSTIPQGEAEEVGEELFGSAWRPAAPGKKAPSPLSSKAEQAKATFIASAFSAISIVFMPNFQAAARPAAVEHLFALCTGSPKPAAGDFTARAVQRVVEGLLSAAKLDIPSTFSRVLRATAVERWGGRLAPLEALPEATWRQAWRSQGSSLSAQALLEAQAAPTATPLTLAAAKAGVLRGLSLSAEDEGAVAQEVEAARLGPLRARLEKWVGEEQAAIAASRAEQQRRAKEAEEAAERARLEAQRQAAAAAARQAALEAEEAQRAYQRAREAERRQAEAEAAREEARRERDRRGQVEVVVQHTPWGMQVVEIRHHGGGGGNPYGYPPQWAPHPMMFGGGGGFYFR